MLPNAGNELRIKSLEDKIAEVSQQFDELENVLKEWNGIWHVLQVIRENKRYLSSAKLFRAPSNYYDQTLNQRANLLGCQVQQLTKCLIVENVTCSHNEWDSKENSRYYCVILQYITKLNTEKLLHLIRNLTEPSKRLPRKQFNFQHASPELSKKLSGFDHNGVCPIALSCGIPIVVSSDILEIQPKYIWMGGGHCDVKLGLSIPQLLSYSNAIIGKVTEPRLDI